jgi:uncharacterized protein YjlB
MANELTSRQPETLFFTASDWVPNHPFLPVLVYRNIFISAQVDSAAAFERLFSDAGWQGLWRNGIFSYQHYHVRAHEVLGIAKGTAELLIGGPGGSVVNVSAGDCLLLPSGTGHMCNSASDDFLVVGAYPAGQHADIETAAATPGDQKIIATLPIPKSDPIYGPGGPLRALWIEL